jgi:hypothetical protein
MRALFPGFLFSLSDIPGAPQQLHDAALPRLSLHLEIKDCPQLSESPVAGCICWAASILSQLGCGNRLFESTGGAEVTLHSGPEITGLAEIFAGRQT